MCKLFFTLIFASTSLFSGPMSFIEPDNAKIGVQNSILAKINGTTISMMDVKKKMDLLFHQHYAHLNHSSQARHQFYEGSWRKVLMEMIDNELILSDAADKEIKLTDGEVREEMESRFGPNVLSTLDRIGVTYDEAWKMIKSDLMVRRMSWWFVQSRAIESVTPREIRQAYQNYLNEHPSYREISYRIISIRSENPEDVANAIHRFLTENGKSPDLIADQLHELHPAAQISSVYTASDLEISEAHKKILTALTPGNYSLPTIQKSRSAQQTIARIFYLISSIDHPSPSFQDLSSDLRNELVQKAIAIESQNYVEKLRKRYGFDAAFLKERCPEDMHPFSLQ